MVSRGKVLAIVGVLACVHPNASGQPTSIVEVLRPAVELVDSVVALGTSGTMSLSPVDSLTRAAITFLARRRAFDLVPAGTQLICPWQGAPSPRGYSVRLRVDSLAADRAIVDWGIGCHVPGNNPRFQAFASGGRLELVRMRGAWQRGRILDHWVT